MPCCKRVFTPLIDLRSLIPLLYETLGEIACYSMFREDFIVRFYLTLSLPNATVVEFTVHCQTRLQSKFKGTVEFCLFLTVIRDATLCSIF